MSVLFSLGILWWAICGFAAVAVGVWFLFGQSQRGADQMPWWFCVLMAVVVGMVAWPFFQNGHWFWGWVMIVAGIVAVWVLLFPAAASGDKHRDRWLLEHFGEEGRKRWIENERRIEEAKRKSLWHEKEKMYGWPHRTSDGRCEGIVTGCLKGMETGQSAPWGSDVYPYPEKHQTDPYWTYGDSTGLNGATRFHGEPNGSDWLAAGFWESVVCHGKVVDPIEALIQQIRREIGKYGCTASLPLDPDSEIGKRVMAEAYRRVKEHEKRTGEKSGIGRRPNMI